MMLASSPRFARLAEAAMDRDVVGRVNRAVDAFLDLHCLDRNVSLDDYLEALTENPSWTHSEIGLIRSIVERVIRERNRYPEWSA
jgi:hypothetical protein